MQGVGEGAVPGGGAAPGGWHAGAVTSPRPPGQPVDQPSRLSRRLGVLDAVMVGLGSMLGTGLFVVFAPAAELAGRWLLVGLLLAAAVAYCNATSAAQLAAVHPESGGAYAYARHRLGPAWGALAGYAFCIGKVASCAAAALAVGAYALPAAAEGWQRGLAAAAVVVLTAVNVRGVTKTAWVTKVLVVGLLAAVAVVVVAVNVDAPAPPVAPVTPADTPLGVLGGAGLLFFAFAGYARITVLGEEVRDPARTIPRAVPIALGVALLTYVLVAVTLLRVLGPGGLAASEVPVVAAAERAAPAVVPLVQAAAVVAALAVLLSLVAGVSRTAFAMGAGGDLPRPLAAVSVHRTPAVAEIAVGVAVLLAVLLGGLRGAVALSAFTVLLYYAVMNVAALRLRPPERRWPRAYAALGLLGCLALAGSLPRGTVVAGALVLAAAMAARAGFRARRGRHVDVAAHVGGGVGGR
jgi:basic amino acid/polyamine antiporter, APA family